MSILSCHASNIKSEQLYGAWSNVGPDDLGIGGIIFITPNYVAYLERTNNLLGYTFKKYLYTLSDNGTMSDIPGMVGFELNNQEKEK